MGIGLDFSQREAK